MLDDDKLANKGYIIFLTSLNIIERIQLRNQQQEKTNLESRIFNLLFC